MTDDHVERTCPHPAFCDYSPCPGTCRVPQDLAGGHAPDPKPVKPPKPKRF